MFLLIIFKKEVFIMLYSTNYYLKDLKDIEEKNYFCLLYLMEVVKRCSNLTTDDEVLNAFKPKLAMLKGCSFLYATSHMQRTIVDLAVIFNFEIGWEKFFAIDMKQLRKDINVKFYNIFYKNVNKDKNKVEEIEEDIPGYLKKTFFRIL